MVQTAHRCNVSRRGATLVAMILRKGSCSAKNQLFLCQAAR
nr:MAG TPA: hypothetical protein [Caudoviricetes sp.]